MSSDKKVGKKKGSSHSIQNHKVTDEKLFDLEIWISHLLRGGVIVSGATILIGWLLFFLSHHPSHLELLFRGGEIHESVVPLSWVDLATGVFQLEPNAIIALGLRFLILLPILRVLLTTVLFVVQKDKVFILLSSLVLCFLSVGLFFGRAL